MKKIKVNIYPFGTQADSYYATTNRDRLHICIIKKSSVDDATWIFLIDDRTEHVRTDDGKFPVDYFKRICQCVWFMKYGAGLSEFPEVELTEKAERTLHTQ